jgi:hypothetical protein
MYDLVRFEVGVGGGGGRRHRRSHRVSLIAWLMGTPLEWCRAMCDGGLWDKRYHGDKATPGLGLLSSLDGKNMRLSSARLARR